MQLARALHTKKVRRERRLLLAEGEDVIDAALERGIRPVALLVDADRVPDDDPRLSATRSLSDRYRVPTALLARVSTLAQPPRLLAVFPQPAVRGFRDVRFPPRVGVFLAGVADPGNVGTLVRSAAALGADWIALGPGSADAFHPRAVRAAMGATFTVPILEGVRPHDLATREGFTVVAADPHTGRAPWDLDLTGPLVLVLGAERDGIATILGEFESRHPVMATTIPQDPGAESLNVAAAGAALLSEIRRQRTSGVR